MSRRPTGSRARATTPRTRCAIYTRKSSDEGLQQDFNSLDAQREAAEAYIASQKAEGWVCLADRYDDGGCLTSSDVGNFSAMSAPVMLTTLSVVEPFASIIRCEAPVLGSDT